MVIFYHFVFIQQGDGKKITLVESKVIQSSIGEEPWLEDFNVVWCTEKNYERIFAVICFT